MTSSKKSLKAALVFVLALILLTNAVLPMAVVGSDNDASAEYQYYSVKSGDTLTRIAQNYGVTVSDIMTANDLSNADKIYTGQILKVPLSSASAKGSSLVSSRISMTVVDANIKDVLSAIALNAGYYIIMEDTNGSNETVTVALEEMSALKAIDYVTRLVGMTFLKDGNTIYVGTADALNSTFVDKTVLTKITLNYISAEGLQAQMNALGLSDVQIVSTNNKDEFYISGYPKELAKVSELIKLLDVSSNIMAGGGMIASNFTPLELEYITADEFNSLLNNLGLSTGIVLSSRPYTLYVYVTGANLTDIKTIKKIVDKPLSGANLAAQGTTAADNGNSGDATIPNTPATTTPSGSEPSTDTPVTPTEPTTENLILREVALSVINRTAAVEILNSFPLDITIYGPEKMTKKIWIAGTEDQVDQAEAYIRQFDNDDYAASVLNDKRFFAYELQNCTASEMLDRLSALDLEGVTFKTSTYAALTKSLIVYCEPYLEESVKALLLEMDTTATSETANRAIESTTSAAVAQQRIDALCALYPELSAYEFTVAEIPGKDGALKCVTYVKASSETADYIKALFEEMNTAA
ncbi:MAG: LysM peptidoglycan-binding domain-containing protein [Candidatus Fimenecus sp.]